MANLVITNTANNPTQLTIKKGEEQWLFVADNNLLLITNNDSTTGGIALGGSNNDASGTCSHAEGYDTTASGPASHAEGISTTASGEASHSEGASTVASGNYSHAEGVGTTAFGSASHSEGVGTIASDFCSHAEGYGTIASGDSQHVEGTYNIEHKGSHILHVVGNGNSDTDRSDAHTLDREGNAWFAGNVYVGGSGQDDGVALASEIMVNNHTTDTNNPHSVTKEQVGLANVNNTADLDKPISYATQAALDEKADVEHVHSAHDITSGTLDVERGGTGYSSITDTTYTTARYRASALMPTETTPADNGVINWVYE